MKTLTLVIPVYNEGDRIRKAIEALKNGFNFRGLKLVQIIFSDDGSTDKTLKVLRSEKALLTKNSKAKVRILTYPQNRGRGYAVRYAALISDSDYTVYADADFSIPLENLKRFMPYLKDGYDLLLGSKKKPGARETIKRSWLRRIIGFGHTLIASVVLGVFAWDFQGGFKIFSRRLIEEVMPLASIDRWGFDMEIIFLAKRLGYKTVELPVAWGHIENGSKVKLARDIIRSLKDIWVIKSNWLKGNYKSSYSAGLVLEKAQ